MAQYVSFDHNTMSSDELMEALLVVDSGINIDLDSVTYQYGIVNSEGSETGGDDYDYSDSETGSETGTEEVEKGEETQETQPPANESTLVTSLSIFTSGDDRGLLLSSGTATPNDTNTSGAYSVSLTNADGSGNPMTDDDLSLTAQDAFSGSGSINDATILQFSFQISDLFIHGITFDLAFGSEEYPEWSNSSYVDIAGIYLNGENIALFNNDANQPLSVISQNLEIGNFLDNTDGHLATEYDGISDELTIYAPVQPGMNTIKIAIADTGDTALDSGLFIKNLAGTQLTGSGLSSVTSGTETNDTITGTQSNETFELGGGDDYIDPGEGDDVVLAGEGDDTIVGGKGDNQIDGGSGVDKVIYAKKFVDTYIKVMDNETIHVGLNSDNLLNIEQIEFSDMTFNTANLLIEDDIAKIYIAYFGRAADPAGLKYWLDQANAQLEDGRAYSDIIFDIASAYSDSAEAESIYTGINAGSMSETQVTSFISSIYTNLFNRDVEQAGLDYWVAEGLAMQENGTNIGTIVKTIIDGAQDQQGQLDRTFMQNKAQVAWNYAKQHELAGAEWDDATQGDEAQAVLVGITSETDSVNAQYDYILTLV